MNITFRVFQILTAIRRTTIDLGDDSDILLPSPLDLHKYVKGLRSKDRVRFGNLQTAISEITDMLLRLDTEKLVTWNEESEGISLSPRASIMVDVIDAGDVDPFENGFIEHWKTSMAHAALYFLYTQNVINPTILEMVAILGMSDQTIRRGLDVLKKERKISVDTSSRLYTYSLEEAPKLSTPKKDPSLAEILGLTVDDDPITVSDLDEAVTLFGSPETPVVEEIPIEPEKVEEIQVQEQLPDIDRIPSTATIKSAFENIKVASEWLMVPPDVQTDFMHRAKACGVTLQDFLGRVNAEQKKRLKNLFDMY